MGTKGKGKKKSKKAEPYRRTLIGYRRDQDVKVSKVSKGVDEGTESSTPLSQVEPHDEGLQQHPWNYTKVQEG